VGKGEVKWHMVDESQAFEFSVGRGTHPRDISVGVSGITVGDGQGRIIAGPCAVEDRASFLDVVGRLSDLGVKLVRANLFKFRTFPSSFQGLGEDGLEILREAKERFGVFFVSEVMSAEHVELLDEVADVFQVGSRSMMNTSLLKRLGSSDKPVLLKRMFAATLGEFLAAAEYIARGGNMNIILCERGVRSIDPWLRFALDVPGIALLRKVSPLPLIVDLSHSLGRKDIAVPVAKAALAAGACGLMVEVHADPASAKSDADQQMSVEEFERLLREVELGD